MFNESNYYKLEIDYSDFTYVDNEEGIGIIATNNKCYDTLLAVHILLIKIHLYF